MSKSLGNFFTVRELLAKAPGEALRLALLSAQYRQPLDFSEDALRQAKTTLDRWYGALRQTADEPVVTAAIPEAVEAALLDDLNTPKAIAALHDLANKLYNPISSHEQALSRAELLASGTALGLLQQDPETWFRWQPAGQQGLSDAAIDAQIAARLAARNGKNYAEADRIRKELAENGVILEDKGGKTTWRRK